MVVVISVSILAVVLTYLSSRSKHNQRSLFVLAFFLVTVLQVIHYDYGADYMGYFEDHMLYNKSWKELLYLRRIGHGAFKDMGWVLIQTLFPGKYGFFLFVGIISVIQNYIYYVLIRDYVVQSNRWKAMAIYLFMTNYYVLSFSGIRQGFAVALCIGAILLASKEKLWLAIVIILLAVSIHVSSIVFLPFIFLPKFSLNRGRLYAVIFSVVAAALYLSTALLGDIYTKIMGLFPLLSRNYGHYIEIMSATEDPLGFGFLMNSIMYIIVIYFIYKRFEEFTKEQKIFLMLVCISFLLIPFSTHLSGIISRLGTYFAVFEIVAVPLVYSKIRNKVVRRGAGAVYAFMMMYSYYEFFFVSEWSSESYATFKTIFSAILE